MQTSRDMGTLLVDCISREGTSMAGKNFQVMSVCLQEDAMAKAINNMETETVTFLVVMVSREAGQGDTMTSWIMAVCLREAVVVKVISKGAGKGEVITFLFVACPKEAVVVKAIIQGAGEGEAAMGKEGLPTF